MSISWGDLSFRTSHSLAHSPTQDITRDAGNALQERSAEIDAFWRDILAIKVSLILPLRTYDYSGHALTLIVDLVSLISAGEASAISDIEAITGIWHTKASLSEPPLSASASDDSLYAGTVDEVVFILVGDAAEAGASIGLIFRAEGTDGGAYPEAKVEPGGAARDNGAETVGKSKSWNAGSA
jgi:hypothetical protein